MPKAASARRRGAHPAGDNDAMLVAGLGAGDSLQSCRQIRVARVHRARAAHQPTASGSGANLGEEESNARRRTRSVWSLTHRASAAFVPLLIFLASVFAPISAMAYPDS